MKYFFEDIEKQNQLKSILKEWEGTPYRHWAGVKQGGCDCIHFVARVLEEFGFGPFQIPKYPKDWHCHNYEELLLNGIRIQLENEIELVNINNPMNGDILLYRFKKVISHAGIYYTNYVYQSLDDIGVQKRIWKDTKWRKRLACGYRILA